MYFYNQNKMINIEIFNFNLYVYLLTEPECDIQHILDQIFYDSDITFPELLTLWRATTKFRVDDIQKASSTDEITKKWKNYLVPLGYKLVSCIV